MFEAKPSGGLFSGLFKRDASPSDQPVDQPQQTETSPVIVFPAPTSVETTADVPADSDPITTQSIAAPKPKAEEAGDNNLSSVSDLVSRWFGGPKSAN
jgi:hypothetical protein